MIATTSTRRVALRFSTCSPPKLRSQHDPSRARPRGTDLGEYHVSRSHFRLECESAVPDRTRAADELERRRHWRSAPVQPDHDIVRSAALEVDQQRTRPVGSQQVPHRAGGWDARRRLAGDDERSTNIDRLRKRKTSNRTRAVEACLGWCSEVAHCAPFRRAVPGRSLPASTIR
jgi:hypothetical protein